MRKEIKDLFKKKDPVEEGYKKAVKVLKMNASALGFSAAPDTSANYHSIWARDHSVCAIAACLTDDPELIETSIKGVLILLKHQIDHGQIPSYIELENRKIVYGGLGTITSVDSNLWIAITAAFLYKRTKDKRLISLINMRKYKRLYRLLKAFDSNDCGLIEVPNAGDWADIFNRTYHVLYDECLYYQALRCLHYLFKERLTMKNPPGIGSSLRKRVRWLSMRKRRVKKRINDDMWFTRENMPRVFEEYMIFEKIKKQEYRYYQSHLRPFKIYWHKRFESFGNILAINTDIADETRKKRIIRYVIDNNINKPCPIRALSPPVFKKDIGWQRIYRTREKTHTYHNGGIWPVISGFWIYALIKAKHERIAYSELKTLANRLKRQRWKFNEYMHGKSAKPMGRKYQAWSAAGYIIAYRSVKNFANIFDF